VRFSLRVTPSDLGRAGERRAARYLKRHGYRVLGRNVRVSVGEADLVCEAPDKRTIVIVEVKTRRADVAETFAPETAVNPAKARKLLQVAQSLIKRNGWADRPVRIDVVGVVWPERGRPSVRHLESSVALS